MTDIHMQEAVKRINLAKPLTKRHAQQIEDRAQYLRDTRAHRVTILKDDGLYRHIRVADPTSSACHFNITTFPGYLTFTGDMGSYVFSQDRDMFEFHRINWDCDIPTIDYRYWAEKVRAVDKDCGIEDFDEDHFKEAALRDFWNHDWANKDTRREEWELHMRDLISEDYQNRTEAIEAMMCYEYTCPVTGRTVRPFLYFYDHGPFTKPSYHLKWACWAIASTIRDYDLGDDRFDRQARHTALILEGEI